MAELQDPLWLQAGSHTAQGDRLLIASLVATEGVVASSDLQVTALGTPAMAVNVASGKAFIAGDNATFQGTYHVANDATQQLTVAAADATNPRKDLVIAEVRDSFYAGASDDWQLRVVTGTPAASPAEPAVPNNAIVLALIDVAAGASSITNGNITDRRALASALATPVLEGEILTSQSTTSLTFTDLATVGPDVVCYPSRRGEILVTVTAHARMNASSAQFVFMSFEVAVVGGGVVLAASDDHAAMMSAANTWTGIATSKRVGGLTPSTQYRVRAKYRMGGGTSADFLRRRVIVEAGRSAAA